MQEVRQMQSRERDLGKKRLVYRHVLKPGRALKSTRHQRRFRTLSCGTRRKLTFVFPLNVSSRGVSPHPIAPTGIIWMIWNWDAILTAIMVGSQSIISNSSLS